MGGLVSRSKAANILGRSFDFVSNAIGRGALKTREVAGKPYVTAESLDRVLGEIKRAQRGRAAAR